MSIGNPAPYKLHYIFGDEPLETKPTVVRWNNHELSRTEDGFSLIPTTEPIGKTSFEKILPGCPCPYPVGAPSELPACGHPQWVVALPDGWRLDVELIGDSARWDQEDEKQILLLL